MDPPASPVLLEPVPGPLVAIPAAGMSCSSLSPKSSLYIWGLLCKKRDCLKADMGRHEPPIDLLGAILLEGASPGVGLVATSSFS